MMSEDEEMGFREACEILAEYALSLAEYGPNIAKTRVPLDKVHLAEKIFQFVTGTEVKLIGFSSYYQIGRFIAFARFDTESSYLARWECLRLLLWKITHLRRLRFTPHWNTLPSHVKRIVNEYLLLVDAIGHLHPNTKPARIRVERILALRTSDFIERAKNDYDG